ncbi:MAG: 30S ribosomal protein S1 [Pseudomonadota bacterium]
MERAEVSMESEGKEFQELSGMYLDSFQSVRAGQVVDGHIVAIGKGIVTVDIGYKSEGTIPLEEFADRSGRIRVKVGEQVRVYIEKEEDEEGKIVLSLDRGETFDPREPSGAVEVGSVVEGDIVSKIKGGFLVDIGLQSFLSFLPGSEVDLQPVENFEEFVGKRYRYRILRRDEKRGNFVISRRALLEEERAKMRAQILKEIAEGQVREGKVKNIADYGVFVDLGGLDGLLHITEMSWDRIEHPSDMLHKNDVIRCKVITYDREKERVSLSLKQLLADPWEDVAEKYPIGTRVTVRVEHLENYGAFVRIEEGIRGLIHISEMSWVKKNFHPQEMLTVAEEIDAVVISMDVPKRKIALSLKQVRPNPWDIIIDKYKVGSIVEGVVKDIKNFGLFVRIEEGIDGLVHCSDISWAEDVSPLDVYKEGETVQAVVLGIDKEREKFSLGIKQLQPNPWNRVAETYWVGGKVAGVVTGGDHEGLAVEIEPGIQATALFSEASEGVLPLMRELAPGVKVEASVSRIDKTVKKMFVAIERLQPAEQMPHLAP